MKEIKPRAKRSSSASRRTESIHSGFPYWYVMEIIRGHKAKPHADSMPVFGVGTMLLNDEIGREMKNPPWSLVERVIRNLDPGNFNSFACLSLPGNTFVQCLCGFNGWHLEWRISKKSGAYVHYRACYPAGSKKPFELKKHDRVSDGEHRDLLKIKDVIDSFHSFHQGLGLSKTLEWRKLDI